VTNKHKKYADTLPKYNNFIFSNHRYGKEDCLVTLYGLLQALVSIVSADGESSFVLFYLLSYLTIM